MTDSLPLAANIDELFESLSDNDLRAVPPDFRGFKLDVIRQMFPMLAMEVVGDESVFEKGCKMFEIADAELPRIKQLVHALATRRQDERDVTEGAATDPMYARYLEQYASFDEAETDEQNEAIRAHLIEQATAVYTPSTADQAQMRRQILEVLQSADAATFEAPVHVLVWYFNASHGAFSLSLCNVEAWGDGAVPEDFDPERLSDDMIDFVAMDYGAAVEHSELEDIGNELLYGIDWEDFEGCDISCHREDLWMELIARGMCDFEASFEQVKDEIRFQNPALNRVMLVVLGEANSDLGSVIARLSGPSSQS